MIQSIIPLLSAEQYFFNEMSVKGNLKSVFFEENILRKELWTFKLLYIFEQRITILFHKIPNK